MTTGNLVVINADLSTSNSLLFNALNFLFRPLQIISIKCNSDNGQSKSNIIINEL